MKIEDWYPERDFGHCYLLLTLCEYIKPTVLTILILPLALKIQIGFLVRLNMTSSVLLLSRDVLSLVRIKVWKFINPIQERGWVGGGTKRPFVPVFPL